MTLYIIIVFLSAFIPGLYIIRKPGYDSKNLHYWLVFAGAYIFSITIVHLIPELFSNTQNPKYLALFILFGFFMQIFIDFLTTGVEHGHAHHHHQIKTPVFSLMIGLTIHAFMDGTILVHSDESLSDHLHGIGLLLGIVVHKIPAAIVLVTVLAFTLKSKKKLMTLLLIFSIATPVGLVITQIMQGKEVFQSEVFNYIFAVVSGNFLHISTTIYFESSPQHRFDKKRVVYALVGAALAVLIDVWH